MSVIRPTDVQRLHGVRTFATVRASDSGCPVCFKSIATTVRGRMHAHRDREGNDCAGGGILRRTQPALDGPPPPIHVPTVVKPRKGSAPNSDTCPDCGRQIRLRGDGTLSKHRPDAEVFVGPYCLRSLQPL